jgi:hypothetical protein
MRRRTIKYQLHIHGVSCIPRLLKTRKNSTYPNTNDNSIACAFREYWCNCVSRHLEAQEVGVGKAKMFDLDQWAVAA